MDSPSIYQPTTEPQMSDMKEQHASESMNEQHASESMNEQHASESMNEQHASESERRKMDHEILYAENRDVEVKALKRRGIKGCDLGRWLTAIVEDRNHPDREYVIAKIQEDINTIYSKKDENTPNNPSWFSKKDENNPNNLWWIESLDYFIDMGYISKDLGKENEGLIFRLWNMAVNLWKGMMY